MFYSESVISGQVLNALLTWMGGVPVLVHLVKEFMADLVKEFMADLLT